MYVLRYDLNCVLLPEFCVEALNEPLAELQKLNCSTSISRITSDVFKLNIGDLDSSVRIERPPLPVAGLPRFLAFSIGLPVVAGLIGARAAETFGFELYGWAHARVQLISAVREFFTH